MVERSRERRAAIRIERSRAVGPRDPMSGTDRGVAGASPPERKSSILFPNGAPPSSVSAVNRSLMLLSSLAFSAASLAALVSACGEDATVSDAAPDSGGGGDAPVDRRAPVEDDAGAEVDARAEASTCALTRSYTLECNIGKDAGDPLNCGAAKFDAWCEANDKAINSAAFRRAEALCLTKKNCDGYDRRDCEYRSYATATPTTAQKAVVAAYCETCEPNDKSCAARKVDYDPTLGPKSTDDVFVAAWELNDTLDDAIRTKCTGTALDAGGDPAACLKAFGSCAADVYLDSVPDCPP